MSTTSSSWLAVHHTWPAALGITDSSAASSAWCCSATNTCGVSSGVVKAVSVSATAFIIGWPSASVARQYAKYAVASASPSMRYSPVASTSTAGSPSNASTDGAPFSVCARQRTAAGTVVPSTSTTWSAAAAWLSTVSTGA